MPKRLIVLDLDETLVHSQNVRELKTNCETIGFFTDELYVAYRIYKRPGVDNFLRMCSEHFDVAVWSAAGQEYVHLVVRLLFDPLQIVPVFVWSSEKCVKYRPNLLGFERVCSSMVESFDTGMNQIKIKPLKKVWKTRIWSKNQTLIVDDTPITYSKNYGNAIRVPEFQGDLQDDVLDKLADYILQLLEADRPWRSIEKRGWLNQINEKILRKQKIMQQKEKEKKKVSWHQDTVFIEIENDRHICGCCKKRDKKMELEKCWKCERMVCTQNCWTSVDTCYDCSLLRSSRHS